MIDQVRGRFAVLIEYLDIDLAALAARQVGQQVPGNEG